MGKLNFTVGNVGWRVNPEDIIRSSVSRENDNVKPGTVPSWAEDTSIRVPYPSKIGWVQYPRYWTRTPSRAWLAPHTLQICIVDLITLAPPVLLVVKTSTRHSLR